MKKLLKSTILALLAPICCACGSGGGGGATDDNNVLYFKNRDGIVTDYFFKGSLRLAVYDTEVANAIFNSQPSGTPEAVKNDCDVAMCSLIATMIKDHGKVTIPLYKDDGLAENRPLAYWTEENKVKIEGKIDKTFTFLKSNTWALSDSVNLFFYFVPAKTTGVTCFKEFKYTLKIKGNFTYYPNNSFKEEEKVKNKIDIDRDNLSHSCYNNSVVLEPLNLGFPSDKDISGVWRPTIELDSISGTITPEFNDQSQWDHIQDYLRKDV